METTICMIFTVDYFDYADFYCVYLHLCGLQIDYNLILLNVYSNHAILVSTEKKKTTNKYQN